VELPRQPRRRGLGFGEHLVEGVVIGSLFLGQTRERAKRTVLPQVADVRRIDVLVGGEGHHVAVLAAIRVVGEQSDAQQIGSREQQLGVLVGEPGLGGNFFADRSKSAVADSGKIQSHLG